MARCKHNSGNIQQFTEVCLDCGRNIYETDEEYEAHLREEIGQLRGELRKSSIDELEELRDVLKARLNKNKSDYDDRF